MGNQFSPNSEDTMLRLILAYSLLALASDALAFDVPAIEWRLSVTSHMPNEKRTIQLDEKPHTFSLGDWDCKVGEVSSSKMTIMNTETRSFDCKPRSWAHGMFSHFTSCSTTAMDKEKTPKTQSYMVADATKQWSVELTCQ